jgi:hypothetical protein
MKKKSIVFLTLFLATAQICPARSKRPNQIPNGTKFSCLNCHNGQGGPRNAFGSMIETGYLTVPGMNGDVVWDSTLAHLEADGDGFANGAELQDTAGVWIAGTPNPGTSSLVTNPGDSKSKPASAVEARNAGILPDRMEIGQNYPNPFNASTRIRIHLPYQDRLRIRIFDLNGTSVWEDKRTMASPGEIEISWDGNDMNQKPLVSGVYLLTVDSGREIRSMRMLLIR